MTPKTHILKSITDSSQYNKHHHNYPTSQKKEIRYIHWDIFCEQCHSTVYDKSLQSVTHITKQNAYETNLHAIPYC